MKKDDFESQLRALKAWILPTVLLLCGLAALVGLLGGCMLFSREYRMFLLRDVFLGGVASPSAAQSYLIVQMILMVAGPAFAGIMAICLAIAFFHRPSLGLSILSTVAEWLVRGLKAVSLALCCLFAYRFIRYTIACLGIDGGAFALFAMILWEGIMMVLMVALFFNLRKFLNCLCDSAASLAYTFATGKLDSASVPGFTATGFFLLGIGCVLMAVDQIFTLTIVPDAYEPYYKLLVTQHPAQWASIACFLLCAVADVLLCVSLRRYKVICERESFLSARSAEQ